MEPKLLGTINTEYGPTEVYLSGYQADENVPAVFLQSLIGEGIATLSVYLPGVELAEGEFLAKTWSENEEIAQAALASGLFEDTGRRVPTGYVEAQVWRLTAGEQNQCSMSQ